MDTELTKMLDNLRKDLKKDPSKKEVSDKDIFWTPVELVKTSFPEKKSDQSRWLKEYGYYSLNLQQLETDRSIPYGMMAREIFEYFFNSFVVNLNQGKVSPNIFKFSSTAEFVNLVKGNPLGTKVSTDQRVLALEMLLNIESCAIRFKQTISEDETISNNNFFIREYRGPSHSKITSSPSTITSGEIEVELDNDTFHRLASSKRVPTKSYLVDLAGNSVTARDLIIFIASQCYSLVKRNIEYIDYGYFELNQILGKSESVKKKDFNKDLKRAVSLLTKNYQELFIYDFFPAELISQGRGNLYLRIYKPKSTKNILCA